MFSIKQSLLCKIIYCIKKCDLTWHLRENTCSVHHSQLSPVRFSTMTQKILFTAQTVISIGRLQIDGAMLNHTLAAEWP